MSATILRGYCLVIMPKLETQQRVQVTIRISIEKIVKTQEKLDDLFMCAKDFLRQVERVLRIVVELDPSGIKVKSKECSYNGRRLIHAGAITFHPLEQGAEMHLNKLAVNQNKIRMPIALGFTIHQSRNNFFNRVEQVELKMPWIACIDRGEGSLSGRFSLNCPELLGILAGNTVKQGLDDRADSIWGGFIGHDDTCSGLENAILTQYLVK